MTDGKLEIVEKKLQRQWSPEQIAGWLGLRGILMVSFRSIYERIAWDRREGGILYLHLQRRVAAGSPGGRGRRARPAAAAFRAA